MDCHPARAGDRIKFQKRKGWHKKPAEYGKEEEAEVLLHWHYDGCVLDCQQIIYSFYGPRFSLHPEFDKVEVIKQEVNYGKSIRDL